MKIAQSFACLAIVVAASSFSQTSSWTEFMSGKRATYTSLGNPKAKGVEVSFDYPASWGGANGKRPNTLYQVTSQGGRGFELCNIGVHNLDIAAGRDPTRNEVAGLFSEGALREFAGPEAQYIAGSRTTIDGQPAAWVQVSQDADRAGIKFRITALVYAIYYDKKFIVLNCSVADDINKSTAQTQARYKTYAPLFQQIANSIVIVSKWKRQ